MRLIAVFLCLQSFEVCCLMMASRAPRPLTSHFVVQDLVKEFTQLVMHKCPGFDWDGSGYQASARSALGDAEALAKHRLPLTILLKLCSTGFPSHPNLRQALTALRSKYQIFNNCTNVLLGTIMLPMHYSFLHGHLAYCKLLYRF